VDRLDEKLMHALARVLPGTMELIPWEGNRSIPPGGLLLKRRDSQGGAGFSVGRFQPFIGGESSVVDSTVLESEASGFREGLVEFMDQFRDEVMEGIRDVWPDRNFYDPPHVEIEAGAARIWFGPRQKPTLEVEPIPLAD